MLTVSNHHDLKTALSGIRGEVAFDAPLAALTSLCIGGPADALVNPEDVHDVCRIVRQAQAARIPIMVLGGTNLLVQDGGIRGIVLNLANLAAVEMEDARLVFAEAGARMPVLLGFAVHHGLSGLEWAAGIPGTVGGAVVMNAGTKLGAMQDCLDAIQMVDLEGRLVTHAAASVCFAYRSVSLPEGVVVGAWLRLTPASRETIDSRTKSYLQYRKQSQPLSQPNAGSVFKNPQGTTAGRLIEEAGLKGCRVGDAQVSTKHANFIVNLGRARSADVLQLIETIQREVSRQTGVTLELEWKVVGER
ncbi:MAG: UDP-N-acetylmuramate dehydrogenase [Nitrospira sp.]|nr:UDP-N-acetylmuramate dehydrogenase [Nitrospira sp.]MDE0406189.1 UDP-N-acetylmuramate dehydrogenase [Nitrospira sp.]MDE0485958.1 UDP-N-acetylmuramate dehydrogenase [Nitrospira sp.]